MGIMDSIKNLFGKGADAAAEHKDKVKDGIDKAGDFAKDKVGDEHADKVDKGVDAAKDAVDKLDQD
jgi:ElaB/YqjD/DUF883 family membrane-anchored ribosome-binding protein